MSASDWRDRAKLVTPGGAQTRSKRDLYPDPVVVQGGQGCQVWDREGRTYTDWIAGLCALGLGHGYPDVDESVVTQITQHGVTFPLPSYFEVEVAEELCAALKWPESVRWVKTGSEATGGAMLIARKATGRALILSIGYHGWHPGHLKGTNLVEGPWGDIDWLRNHLRGSYVAGVLLEPMRDLLPPAGYLAAVREECQRARTLLIFDEVVTGFRWAVGGAGEYYGIRPDLACFGKALANGYPLGAIVGPRDLMAYADGVSSTFGGECTGLAAARAVLGVYAREPVIKRMWEVGEYLMSQMAKAGHPMLGYPVHPRFAGEKSDVVALSHKAAANGHLFHPAGVNIMYAHSEDDVDAFVRALK